MDRAAQRYPGAPDRGRRREDLRPRALAAAGQRSSTPDIDAADAVDLIVLATSTPDQTFPATAVTVQAELGITRGAAFDMQAVCSGFVFALAVADQFLRSGEHRCGRW
jgi:3-oxoacyl-[acyl-carrier-protein] synthase III